MQTTNIAVKAYFAENQSRAHLNATKKRKNYTVGQQIAQHTLTFQVYLEKYSKSRWTKTTDCLLCRISPLGLSLHCSKLK